MAIINDTDLLRIEPALFLDAAGSAVQLIASDDGEILGTELSSSKSDFSAVVEEGAVIVVAGQPLEVVELLSAVSLEVSRRRMPEADPLAPGDGSDLEYQVLTFAMQIQDAERWLARTLGLDSYHPDQPTSEANVLNYQDFAPLVAARVIAGAFASAAAADPEDLSLQSRAEFYERVCHDLRPQMIAAMDLDGDGAADEWRRLSVGTWVRI